MCDQPHPNGPSCNRWSITTVMIRPIEIHGQALAVGVEASRDSASLWVGPKKFRGFIQFQALQSRQVVNQSSFLAEEGRVVIQRLDETGGSGTHQGLNIGNNGGPGYRRDTGRRLRTSERAPIHRSRIGRQVLKIELDDGVASDGGRHLKIDWNGVLRSRALKYRLDRPVQSWQAIRTVFVE